MLDKEQTPIKTNDLNNINSSYKNPNISNINIPKTNVSNQNPIISTNYTNPTVSSNATNITKTNPLNSNP